MKEKQSMNSIDFLTTFSGKRAEQYESYFRYSDSLRIVDIEIHGPKLSPEGLPKALDEFWVTDTAECAHGGPFCGWCTDSCDSSAFLVDAQGQGGAGA